MRALLLFPMLGAVGCVNGPIDAPFGSTVEVPEGVTVIWDDAYNGVGDDIGALTFFDVMVFDPEGFPLEGALVEVNSNSGGVYIIPAEAIRTVDAPAAPEDIAAACEDEDGNYTGDDDACAWNYDTVSGTYFQFGSGYADAEGYAPTYQRDVTDGRGILRVYGYIDALGVDSDGNWGAAQITVSIGVDAGAYLIEGA
jgi:hypothetical protein